MSSIFENPKFQLLDKVVGKPSITVTDNGVGFSKQALSRLNYAHYVLIYINRVDKQLGIKACREADVGSIKFVPKGKDKVDSLRWNNPTFKDNIKSLVSKELAKDKFTCDGEYLEDEDALLFDFTKARPLDK